MATRVSDPWLAINPDGYFEEAPVVHVEKSTVVKDSAQQDLVLHTVKVSAERAAN